MKRSVYNQLLNWKQKYRGSTALLLDGARRIGKSYIAEKFAQKEYKSYILIDFNNVTKEVIDLFENYSSNLDKFFMYLETIYNCKLYQRNSVIVFDEVQLYPKARSLIKYLVADGRYDYIETGSLISIKRNVKDIVIPSEEQHLEMFPMNFEEFLWATDNSTLFDIIQENFEKKEPMGQALHRKAMDLFRSYMVVGGMPQAVKSYIQKSDFELVDQIKRNILNIYREDISKYASNYKIRVKSIFDEIPSQLQKHEKKFKWSSLGKDIRFRNCEDALFWLSDGMIANLCYNISEPNIGLELNRKRMTLKCYMSDTGLLFSHAFDKQTIDINQLYQKIMFNKLSFNKGMLVENIVAQMLRAKGRKLYFYSNSSKDNKDDRMEIDFLITKNGITSKHNIIPIEVKSGKNYTLSSIKKFKNKFIEQTDVPIILYDGDVCINKEELMCLPLYMTGLL
ncbi:MAG: ATP-binding protein [Alphaproteobacteria bacterium]|nr:ATP-binding protein [Alphaproteobacteria bacterium]